MTESDGRQEDDLLAGEYVLHLLDPEARAAFERRLSQDLTLRRLVHDWEIRLADLAVDLPEVAPPAALRAALLKRIAPEGGDRKALPRWLFGFGAGFAVLLLLTVFMAFGLLTGPGERPPSYLAELVAESEGIVMTAAYVPEDSTLLISRSAGAARPGRSLELWLFPEGSPTAVSLGVLPDEAEARILVPGDYAGLVATGTLAISDEPPGGSPTGSATGDVLAVAAVQKI